MTSTSTDSGAAESILDRLERQQRYAREYRNGFVPSLAECEAADTVRAMVPEPRLWGHPLKPHEAVNYLRFLEAAGLTNADLEPGERGSVAWLAGMDSTDELCSLMGKVRERAARAE